jgi:hypothetical protein
MMASTRVIEPLHTQHTQLVLSSRAMHYATSTPEQSPEKNDRKRKKMFQIWGDPPL